MGSIRMLLVAAVAMAPARLAGQDQRDLERRVDSLFAEWSRGDTPGAAVAVVRDGKVVLSKGYGLANLEHKVPITPSTVFDVASVSKQFAGLSVAMLVDQGKIQLKDDIRKYIPEMKDIGATITIDNLVHHTSGLRDWPGSLRLAGWMQDDVFSFDQILAMAYRQRTLNFAPGSEYTYSNTGFNLLAEMVKRVTGKTFRAWTDENLFQPLGMTASHFHDDWNEVVPNRALGYMRGPGGKFRAITNNLTALGSSSLFTTVEDLAKWVINFDDAKVGGKKAMELSRTRGVLTDGTTIPYAFGIVHGEYRGQPTLSHGGSWAAFATTVLYFPAKRFGVVVLANSPIVPSGRRGFDIADIYLGSELGPVPADSLAAVASAPTVDVPTATLDRYVGLYRAGPGRFIRIRRDGNQLEAEVPGMGKSRLAARGDTLFWSEATRTTVAFNRTGTAVRVGNQRDPYAKLAPSREPTRGQLASYAGEYESAELLVSYRVEVTDSGLVMRNPRTGVSPLRWVWRDEFKGSMGLNSVEFIRDKAGKITGLSIDLGERSRDIRFVRRR